MSRIITQSLSTFAPTTLALAPTCPTMEFQWAERYPDIRRICVLFQRSELQRIRKVHYTPLIGYMQEGPQCGLVALAIARGDPCRENVQRLLELAKEMGYTRQGEVCGAEYLHHLAELYLDDGVTVGAYRGHLDSNEIRTFLLAGGVLLVPFDADQANNPGQLKGHKAHWAVISGGIETPESFFVVARHGKARNIAIWPLKDLADSNAQLEEFSPSRQQSDLQYMLPEGGIGGPNGLKFRAILINDPRFARQP